MMVFCLNRTMMHDLPTSFPAPRGVMTIEFPASSFVTSFLLRVACTRRNRSIERTQAQTHSAPSAAAPSLRGAWGVLPKGFRESARALPSWGNYPCGIPPVPSAQLPLAQLQRTPHQGTLWCGVAARRLRRTDDSTPSRRSRRAAAAAQAAGCRHGAVVRPFGRRGRVVRVVASQWLVSAVEQQP
jgi:hypothetical protein